MARMKLLVAAAAAAALFMLIAAPSAFACTTTASPFFGSPWQPAFAMFSTENAWKKHGNISRIDLFYTKSSGCLSGLRVTYAKQGDTARLLGVDRVGKATATVTLGEKEFINKAEVAYSNCITYFSLSTNKQREISVGDSSKVEAHQTSSPDATGGFLAYVKAFTDEQADGTMKRLQLIWTTSDCADQAPGLRTPTVPDAELLQAEQGSVLGDENRLALADPQPAAAVCRPGNFCKDGVCPTSSCAVNGMGKDVMTMACFGTNTLPNPLLSLAGGNPCQHLACKLDKANCTSISLLGVGGFCTGTVVATGANAKLHATGKALLGYPCIEHQGPIVNLLPFADYTARGTYMTKAWKVCDCSSGLAAGTDSTTQQLQVPEHTAGNASVQSRLSITLPRFPSLRQFPFTRKALVNMTVPDIVSQWLAANDVAAEVPSVDLTADQVSQIKQLVPNFTLPSIVVPRISAPLLRLPDHLSLPVFQIPLGNNTIQRFAASVPNITSLPTLLLPRNVQKALRPKFSLTIPEITIPNLGQLASSFGIPKLPNLSPVFDMGLQDTLAQWAAAKQLALPLPRVHLQEEAIQALQEVVQGFRVPCLLATNISLPLFRLPSPFPVPIVVLDNNNPATAAQVASIIPKLSALPTFVLPAKSASVRMPRLPHLTVPNITVPNFDDVIARLGAALDKRPTLPSVNFSLPQLEFTVPKLNISLPDVAGMKLPELDFVSPEQQQENPQLNLTGLVDMLKAIKTLTDALSMSDHLTNHSDSSTDQAAAVAATVPGHVLSAALDTQASAAAVGTAAVATDDSTDLEDTASSSTTTAAAATSSDVVDDTAEPVPAAEQGTASGATVLIEAATPSEGTGPETSAAEEASLAEQSGTSASTSSSLDAAAAAASPMEVPGAADGSRMRLAAQPAAAASDAATDAAEPHSTWQSVDHAAAAAVGADMTAESHSTWQTIDNAAAVGAASAAGTELTIIPADVASPTAGATADTPEPQNIETGDAATAAAATPLAVVAASDEPISVPAALEPAAAEAPKPHSTWQTITNAGATEAEAVNSDRTADAHSTWQTTTNAGAAEAVNSDRTADAHSTWQSSSNSGETATVGAGEAVVSDDMTDITPYEAANAAESQSISSGDAVAATAAVGAGSDQPISMPEVAPHEATAAVEVADDTAVGEPSATSLLPDDSASDANAAAEPQAISQSSTAAVISDTAAMHQPTAAEEAISLDAAAQETAAATATTTDAEATDHQHIEANPAAAAVGVADTAATSDPTADQEGAAGSAEALLTTAALPAAEESVTLHDDAIDSQAATAAPTDYAITVEVEIATPANMLDMEGLPAAETDAAATATTPGSSEGYAESEKAPAATAAAKPMEGST